MRRTTTNKQTIVLFVCVCICAIMLLLLCSQRRSPSALTPPKSNFFLRNTPTSRYFFKVVCVCVCTFFVRFTVHIYLNSFLPLLCIFIVYLSYFKWHGFWLVAPVGSGSHKTLCHAMLCYAMLCQDMLCFVFGYYIIHI